MSAAGAPELSLQVQPLNVVAASSSSTSTALEGIELHPQWHVLARLPMCLTAAIPMPHFRVRDLLNLRAGQMLESVWPSNADVPLTVGDTRLSWAEFDAVEQRLAVRLTRLA